MVANSGSYAYTFLSECGIDQRSGAKVLSILQKTCELRAQYFPNSHFCALESLQRLLDLLDVKKPSNARADHWMFVMRYVKESYYDRSTRKHVQETCKRMEGLRSSPGAGVLVHGLWDRNEES